MDGGCLEKVTGAKMELVVVEMVLRVVAKGGLSQFGAAVGGGCIGVVDGLWVSVGHGVEGNKGGTVMSDGGEGACVVSGGVS